MRKSKKIGNKYGTFILIDTEHKNKDTIWVVRCSKCGHTQKKCRHSVEKQITECERCGNPPKNRNSNGHYKERIYHIYTSMLQRTSNKNKDGYCYYGGKGIFVCEEWQNDFMRFYNWAYENGYNDNLTIDRIDVNREYSPENCRWVTAKEQSNNRSTSKKYTICGETKTVSQWADKYNVSKSLIYNRLKLGWDIEKALKTPIDVSKRSKKYECKKYKNSTVEAV